VLNIQRMTKFVMLSVTVLEAAIFVKSVFDKIVI